MKKLILIIFSAIAVQLWLCQIDDDLSIDAVDLVNRLNVDGESRAYLYLTGIFANENDNPEDVGRKILEEQRKLDADASYKVVEYEVSKKIPLPEGGLFCQARNEECISTLFSSKIDMEKIFQENRVLILRSKNFFEFSEYKTLTKPSFNEIFPPYQYIASAEKIKLLEAISIYQHGNPKEAIESLQAQLQKLRKSLELQDNLIGKMVFLAMLADVIDVSSVILSNEGIKVEHVHGLSPAEKSFHMVAAREFGTSYYTFKNLDRHPEIFEIGGKFPGWVARILFKPNMTINAVTPIYRRFERLVQYSPSEFSAEIEQGNFSLTPTSKMRNYIGATLVAVAPNFDEYVARFHDFEAKIALFNHMHVEGGSAGIKNPYWPDREPIESNGAICFDGPLKDNRFLRCLRLKL